MSEEVMDYIFEFMKEEIIRGIKENPRRFNYTNYILAMVEELELNPKKTAQGAYEGIVKEFVSYVKYGQVCNKGLTNLHPFFTYGKFKFYSKTKKKGQKHIVINKKFYYNN